MLEPSRTGAKPKRVKMLASVGSGMWNSKNPRDP